MINEKQLQAACVVKFRELWPERKNSLWLVRNLSMSGRDGMSQRAQGMRPGVADLSYFFRGEFTGIELKLPGKSHDSQHVRQQMEYGRDIVKQGGFYFIVLDLPGFLWVVEGRKGPKPEGVLSIKEIEQKLSISKTKIKF